MKLAAWPAAIARVANGRENVNERSNEIQISDKQPFNKLTDMCTLGGYSHYIFVFKMFHNTFLSTLPVASTPFNFALIEHRCLVLQVVKVIENTKPLESSNGEY